MDQFAMLGRILNELLENIIELFDHTQNAWTDLGTSIFHSSSNETWTYARAPCSPLSRLAMFGRGAAHTLQ